MQAQYYRNLGHEVLWDNWLEGKYWADKIILEPENIPFNLLPSPDRIWTKAFDKKYQQNGNFKYHPATYMQVANGCWWGKCKFCVEQKNKWEVRPVEDVIEELKECERLGFKEVFDDSGTFPIGMWLDKFFDSISSNSLNLRYGCNMRMVDAPYRRMRDCGFRMVLFGVESANQQTLDRINKGVKVEDIKWIKKAAEAGLDCHISVIFGFPFESDMDAINTLILVKDLLQKGIAKTAQASFYSVEGQKGNESHRKYVDRIYEVGYSPQFWFHQLKDIKNLDDIKYLWRKIKEGLTLFTNKDKATGE